MDLIGSKLSSYRVTAKLGEGGMGEVWRATDERLGREVALKLLPESVAADSERLSRFQREARVLASLNHPNIAGLHTLEEVDGRHVLVMELVAGEDLADRLDRGALPIDEALRVARGIALALSTAHSAGIVHRDLKPANVRLTTEGEVKVLDFGLAKAWQSNDDENSASLSLSPTCSHLATAAGVILGTASYMSPEQARGKSVDQRADVWAFGAVLWEMLTGRRLFAGGTVSDIIANVINGPVDFSTLPPDTPPSIKRLLRRCLERDRSRRLRDLGDAILELDEEDDTSVQPTFEVGGTQRARWLALAAAGLLGAALAVGAMLSWPRSVVEFGAVTGRQVIRFPLPPAPDTTFELDLVGPGPPVLSSDGRRIAFTARTTDGVVQVWIRDLDQVAATAVPGSEGAQYPFWSVDGESIAYFGRDSGMLHRIDLESGRRRTVCPGNNGKGGTWNDDGVIVFSPGPTVPLYRVSAQGGESRAITVLDTEADINSHRHPRFLPDGNRFIYLARSRSDEEQRQVRLGSLDGSIDVKVTTSVAAAIPVGDLLLLSEGSGLVARPFDADSGTVGESLGVLAVDVSDLEGAARSVVDATEHTLVMLQGDVPTSRQLRWYGTDGSGPKDVGPSDEYLSFFLSPTGRNAVVSSGDEIAGTQDLWLVDTESGMMTRLTSDKAEDMSPQLSVRGELLFFSSTRSGGQTNDSNKIYSLPLDRSSPPRMLMEAEKGHDLRVSCVSSDNRWIVATLATSDGNHQDVVAIHLSEDGHEILDQRTMAGSEFREASGVLSPDGQWLAYVSYEASDPQVFVTPFPDGGRRWRISKEGGVWPLWVRQDHIVYQNLKGIVLKVPVEIEEGVPRLKEPEEMVRLSWVDRNYLIYGVTSDLTRVMSLDFVNLQTDPMTVVIDWQNELER